jgi:epoxide hydrolase-like predicted phosphatase
VVGPDDAPVHAERPGRLDVADEVVEEQRSLGGDAAEFRDLWRPLLPLDELFDVVIDSSEVGVRKPDPRIYHLTLEHLGGLAPERALFLDDFVGNVEAARALGMHGIVVGPDHEPAMAELRALLDLPA